MNEVLIQEKCVGSVIFFGEPTCRDGLKSPADKVSVLQDPVPRGSAPIVEAERGEPDSIQYEHALVHLQREPSRESPPGTLGFPVRVSSRSSS